MPWMQVLKKEDEAANAATYACELEKVHARVYHVPVHGRYLRAEKGTRMWPARPEVHARLTRLCCMQDGEQDAA